jgi:membrane protein insertase Oxa1/YidC/SpoIIIJ
MKEASSGVEPSQQDMNAVMTAQTGIMMPIMMLFIMLNLSGAIVFYYLLSSGISLAQQTLIYRSSLNDMDILADKKIIKEYNKITEAEVIKNKKTGTKITSLKGKGGKL